MEIIDKHPAFDFDLNKIHSHLFSDKCPDYLSGVKYLTAVEAKVRIWERNTLYGKNKDRLYEAILNYWPRIYATPPNTLRHMYGIDHMSMDEIEMLIAQAKKEDLSFNVGAHFATLRAAFEMVINKISAKIDDLKQEIKYLQDTEQISHEKPDQRRRGEIGRYSKEIGRELEPTEDTDPTFELYEDFGTRLGLLCFPRVTAKIFHFMESRNYIESLTFEDKKFKWIRSIPLLKGFLEFLVDEEGVLDRAFHKNVSNCFLTKSGKPLNMYTFRKTSESLPLFIKNELKKIISSKQPQ